MATLKIYDDSKNYTASVVKLPNPVPLSGLDNLVGVTVFGNLCIIPKSYDLNQLYVFFPSETVLSKDYLRMNNLYCKASLNEDQNSKGYFHENGRVKALKLKGNVSTGVVMPVSSLYLLETGSVLVGDEFNEINGIYICRKYVVPRTKTPGMPGSKVQHTLTDLIDKKQLPEHIDTDHLLKNLDKLKLSDEIIISYKIHGTSGRCGYTLTKRKLKWYEKIAKRLGVKVVEEEYNYAVGSRRVVKSIAFNELKNKQHYYTEDLWTKVCRELFQHKLNQGEMIYFEVVGKDYSGAEIQKGYTYGNDKPVIYVYRISNINPQGIEVDLPWLSMAKRAEELGVNVVPIAYGGSLGTYLKFAGISAFAGKDWAPYLQETLTRTYMDKPSVLDKSVIEEGICLRIETYPRPRTYKMKSPLFLLHEGKMADAQVLDVETAETTNS